MKEDLEQKEINYVRNKTAGSDVFDRNGNRLISRGDTITDDAIEHARQDGMLHALMLSAASAVMEAGGDEARRRMQEFRDITENHEAEYVRDAVVARDVFDPQGNLIIEAGQRVTDEVIECARRQSLLQELVLAVGATGQMAGGISSGRKSPASEMGYNPFASGERNP